MTEYVAFIEPLPSVKSLNTNTVESHFLQVTTIYQVPDWGWMGTGEPLSAGGIKIGAGGRPRVIGSVFQVKIERSEFFRLRLEV